MTAQTTITTTITTIRELVEKLREFDPDMPVVICDGKLRADTEILEIEEENVEDDESGGEESEESGEESEESEEENDEDEEIPVKRAKRENKRESELVHICGFEVGDDESSKDIEIKEPAKLFKLPFSHSGEKMHYIGIEIKREDSPFDVYSEMKGDAFLISNVKKNERIAKMMQELYHERKISYHSFLQNVYTSHYYYGNVMVGYFVDNDENSELSDIIDGQMDEDVGIYNVAHTLGHGCDSFAGKIIDGRFANFEFSHREHPGERFFQVCTTKHDINDYGDFNLSFKDGVEREKVIAFVPEMCYCCT